MFLCEMRLTCSSHEMDSMCSKVLIWLQCLSMKCDSHLPHVKWRLHYLQCFDDHVNILRCQYHLSYHFQSLSDYMAIWYHVRVHVILPKRKQLELTDCIVLQLLHSFPLLYSYLPLHISTLFILPTLLVLRSTFSIYVSLLEQSLSVLVCFEICLSPSLISFSVYKWSPWLQ